MKRAYRSINVENLEGFINFFSNEELLKNEIQLFRGQSRSDRNLESGLYRNLRDENLLKSFYKTELKSLELFFKKQQNKKWNNHSIIQKLSIAQHYGAKTSLIDWTEDIRGALFFAFSSRNTMFNKAIFSIIIDPWDIIPQNYQGIPSHRIIKFINPIDFIQDKRIINQKGWFSTQAAKIYPLEKIRSGDGLPKFDKMGLIEDDHFFNYKITKYILPNSLEKDVLKYLKEHSIDESFIFPDIKKH